MKNIGPQGLSEFCSLVNLMSLLNSCKLPVFLTFLAGSLLLAPHVRAQDLTPLAAMSVESSSADSANNPASSSPAPAAVAADNMAAMPGSETLAPVSAPSSAAPLAGATVPALPNANEPPQLPIVSQQGAAPTLPGATVAPSLPGQVATPTGELTSDDLAVPNFFGNQSDMLGLNEEPDFSYEKSKTELQEEARRQAFEQALQALLPLRPNEIREMLEKFDRTQESVEVPVYPPPKPQMVVQNISLDPGAPPAVIKMAYGHVTTLSILDASGAPWPIEDISWAGDFEITETSAGEGAHIVRISPKSEYAVGNMSMRLLTLKTPVIIMMETNRDIVHYRFDAIIPDYGPFASAPLITQGVSIQAGDQTLSSVLQGLVPNGAERLNVAGVDGRTSAYRIGAVTYVRTPLTLLSPSWTNSVASADGMRVYTIKDAPILLLSDKGKMMRAHLSDREDIFE